MNKPYNYPGEELRLFEKAKKWKEYFAEKIKPYIQGNVLEAGAGMGETTPYLLTNHVNSWTSLEPDENLFAILQKKITSDNLPTSWKAQHGTLSILPSDAQFNTILYIDVLEHIEDDHGELAKAVSHLKDGGHLIVLSPAFQMFYSPFDKAIGHHRRYTKKTLRKVVSITELEEKRMFYMESTGAFLLMLNKYLLKMKYPTKNQIGFWQTVLVPVSKLLDKILFYRFGKTIVGIWQKPRP